MMTGLSGRQLVIVIIMVELASAMMVFGLLASQGRIGLGIGLALTILVIPLVLIPLTLYGLGTLVGWRSAAALYPETPDAPTPKSRRVCSMAVRWPFMGFNNVILSATDESHLHLRFVDVFSFGTPPLSIPWAAVTEITPSALGRAKLTIIDAPPMWVPKELVKDEVALRKEMTAEP
ncbi:unnamed protein product [Symbiodinium necroappetens]|uniref:Uncharacterized protein n=1 Tax=Symbiodinium necroappetens TaxID=1628268 RepID=A0A812W7P3_9DINO|nr:unnamed protein product [Symbiodinium necroappetens]